MRERSSREGRKYAAIPNDAMRDTRLSAEARGTLALLMTYSDDWHFHRDKLMELLNVGRDKFQKIMKELADCGYVELVTMRSEKGHLTGTTWIIRDDPEPSTESLKTRSSDATESLKNRRPVFPTAGESAPLRRTTLKENQIKENVRESGLFPEQDIPQATSVDQHFTAFWKAYPKAVGKPAAQRNFLKAVKDGEDPERIVEGARRYAAWLANPKPGEFRPIPKHPQGWLTDQRWNDPDLWVQDQNPARSRYAAIREEAERAAQR